MPPRIDISGQRFGRLIAIERSERSTTKVSYWHARCDCGIHVCVALTSLRNGLTGSCGCLHKEILGSRRTTFEMRGTPEYRAWNAAKNRCENPKNKGFPHYGGRGIKMAEQWRTSFETFYSHLGPRPFGKTLNRIDNSRGYEPGNCRWATRSEQNKNRRPFKIGVPKDHEPGSLSAVNTALEIAAQMPMRSSNV